MQSNGSTHAPPAGPPPAQDGPASVLSSLPALIHALTPRVSPVAITLVICRDGVESTAVYAAGGAPKVDALVAALHERFVSFAGDSHSACAQAATTVERLDGAKATEEGPAVESPIIARGRVAGLLRAVVAAGADKGAPDAVHDLAGAISAVLEGLLAAEDEGRRLLGRLADGIPEGVVVVTGEGDVFLANEAARRLLAEMTGRAGAAGVRLVDTPLGQLVREARAAGQPRAVDYALRENPRRSISARAQPLPGGDTVVLLLRDVTEERLLHERLLQSEKMASVGQLVSGVAHELNNPLTGVVGFAQLILMRDLDERTRHEVETIQNEAERAAKIVQNLLSFARRRRAEKELVDVNVLLQRVLELRAYDLRVRSIEVDMQLDADLPRTLADADQLQQVFLNMIINAEQAMLQDNGRGRLTVATAHDNEYVRVTFRDDGPGIEEENLRRIFDPFFTTKEPGAGTGLGLTIAYGIVQEHGGRITVDSSPGKGATFTIDVPIVQGPPGAAGRGAPEEPAAAGAVKSRRILIVDDEESIRQLLRGMLVEEGHNVSSAASGKDALEQLAGERYDLVITDIKMPEMSGEEFYRQLRESDGDLARRMIFITGDTINIATRQFLHSVRNPCLAKPFRLDEVRQVIERQLADV